MDNLNSQSSTDHPNPQVWNFVSAPNLHPMKVTINVNKPGTAPAYYLLRPIRYMKQL
ncbi:hypothetical protein MUB16_27105 [Priestia sp. OVL9]|nr:hypothetical protein [Priestia sp. OVL9]